jgi:anti-sigma regulatory factor (Ser/Thr protein kinase)
VPQVQETFSAAPRNVSAARRFVADTLAQWDADAFEWAAITAVSELTTNAVLHARTGFTLSLRLEDDLLRLEVTDQSALLPRLRNHTEQASTGRGMSVVYALAAAHGVVATSSGKTVWCEVRANGESYAAISAATASRI